MVKFISYPSLLTLGFVLPIAQTQQDLFWNRCLIAGISHCSENLPKKKLTYSPKKKKSM